MCCLQDIVFFRINKSLFLMSMCSPEQKYYTTTLLGYFFNNCICKISPPLSCMRCWLSCLDSKYCIKQEYSLLCPFYKISRLWSLSSKFIYKFEIDISQGGWDLYSILYRKTQSMCLIWSVVWILSKYHDSHLI